MLLGDARFLESTSREFWKFRHITAAVLCINGGLLFAPVLGTGACRRIANGMSVPSSARLVVSHALAAVGRLDRVLPMAFPHLSRRQWRAALEEGCVRRNGEVTRVCSKELAYNDVLSISVEKLAASTSRGGAASAPPRASPAAPAPHPGLGAIPRVVESMDDAAVLAALPRRASPLLAQPVGGGFGRERAVAAGIDSVGVPWPVPLAASYSLTSSDSTLGGGPSRPNSDLSAVGRVPSETTGGGVGGGLTAGSREAGAAHWAPVMARLPPNLHVLHCDSRILVVSKPAGVLCQPVNVAAATSGTSAPIPSKSTGAPVTGDSDLAARPAAQHAPVASAIALDAEDADAASLAHNEPEDGGFRTQGDVPTGTGNVVRSAATPNRAGEDVARAGSGPIASGSSSPFIGAAPLSASSYGALALDERVAWWLAHRDNNVSFLHMYHRIDR